MLEAGEGSSIPPIAKDKSGTDGVPGQPSSEPYLSG